MASVRFNVLTKKTRTPKAMTVPPTSASLLQHILRVHLTVMLWKPSHCEDPGELSDIKTLVGVKI